MIKMINERSLWLKSDNSITFNCNFAVSCKQIVSKRSVACLRFVFIFIHTCTQNRTNVSDEQSATKTRTYSFSDFIRIRFHFFWSFLFFTKHTSTVFIIILDILSQANAYNYFISIYSHVQYYVSKINAQGIPGIVCNAFSII